MQSNPAEIGDNISQLCNSVRHDGRVFPVSTSVQSNVAKGRIAVLSPLAAANAFISSMRWTGTFARGGRRRM